MRSIIAVFLLFIALVGWAQSADQGQPTSKGGKKAIAVEKHGTEKNPLVVKSYEAEKTPERTEQERPEARKERRMKGALSSGRW